MARPVPIPDLRPHESTLEAMRRIIPVRLDELYALAPTVADPAATRGHHDMRIAAKRLRYTLEIFRFLNPDVFGPAVAKMRAIQDQLGLVHDLDVFVPFGERYLEHRREETAAELGRLLFPDGESGDSPHAVADVRRTLNQADGTAERKALLHLIEHLRAQRRHLFADFQQYWQGLVSAGFRESLLAAIGGLPPVDRTLAAGQLTGDPRATDPMAPASPSPSPAPASAPTIEDPHP